MGVAHLQASLAGVGNWNVAETAVAYGVTAPTFALTAGGGTACEYTFVLTHYDSRIQVRSGAAGWTVYFLPHAITGAGVNVFENLAASVVTIVYEAGVSTRALVDAAITATCKYVFVAAAGVATGAIAATEAYAHAMSTTPTTQASLTSATSVVLRYTHTVTTITVAKAAMAANPGVAALMTCSGGTGTTALVTGDAIVAAPLAGGVAAVAIATKRGKGYTPTKTATTGQYSIVLDSAASRFICGRVLLHTGSASPIQAQFGTWTPSTRTLLVNLWDTNAAAVANLAPGTGNELHFRAVFSTATFD